MHLHLTFRSSLSFHFGVIYDFLATWKLLGSLDLQKTVRIVVSHILCSPILVTFIFCCCHWNGHKIFDPISDICPAFDASRYLVFNIFSAPRSIPWIFLLRYFVSSGACSGKIHQVAVIAGKYWATFCQDPVWARTHQNGENFYPWSLICLCYSPPAACLCLKLIVVQR